MRRPIAGTFAKIESNQYNYAMHSYLVIYELNELRGDYQPLVNKIVNLFAHYFAVSNSAWIVTSDLFPEDIVVILKQYIYINDKILVVKADRSAAWEGLTVDDERWLKNYL